MNVHCADCDNTFLLSPDGATQSAACPHCGGKRLERDQPSPTHSDGDLRDMVDPGLGLDQGGNPHQEGIWGQVDGGWQPWTRRDESYASVHVAEWDPGDMGFDFTEKNPTHKFILDDYGKVYSLPEPTSHEAVADAHGLIRQGNFPKGYSLGELYDNGETGWFQHETQHSPEAMASMLYGHFGQPVVIDPELRPTTNEERFGIPLGYQGPASAKEHQILEGPPVPRQRPGHPYDREGLIRGGSIERSLNMEPYLPWTHMAEALPQEPQAKVQICHSCGEPLVPGDPICQRCGNFTEIGPQHTATVTPGPYGIHAGTIKWLQFLDAHVNGRSARQDPNGMFATHGFQTSPEFGQPVEVAVHHPEHLPGAINTIETSAQGSTPAPKLKELALAIHQGLIPPPPGINPAALKFGHKMAAALPLAGLGLEALGIGGGGAIMGGLMRGALIGTGSHLVQGLLGGGGASPGASQPQEQILPPRDPSMLSSVREADLETPHGNPGYYHDDPEAIDQHEFQDQSTDPNFNNPTVDAEAGGAQTGEDNVKAQFSPGALERAQVLMPLIMHYYHSDESGANDPLLRELHQQLEQERPGYMDEGDDNAVNDFFKKLREPSAVAAKVAGPFPPAPNYPSVPGSTAGFGHCPHCGADAVEGGGSMARCKACGWSAANQPLEFPHNLQLPGEYVPSYHGKTAAPGIGVPTMTGPQQQQGIPNQAVPAPTQQTTGPGACPYCGSPMTADGSCPTCGAKVGPMGGGMPGAGINPGAMPYGGNPGGIPRAAASHQGPVTDEQKSAVAELLLQEGRAEEIPNMLQNPWDYAKEMAEVAQKINQAPNVDPNDPQPPQPAQEVAPPGATMPVPNPADPSQQQMMGSTRVAFDPIYRGPAQVCPNCHQGFGPGEARVTMQGTVICPHCGYDWQGVNTQAPSGRPGAGMGPPTVTNPGQAFSKQATPHTLAPRCPKCHSATTGFVHDGQGDVQGQCHACGNVWNIDEAAPARTAAPNNPNAVPAADHQQRYDDADVDSTQTWTDDSGQPLVEGGEYEMHSPQYQIPDIVRVDKIKPDSILVSTIGEYSNSPQDGEPLAYQHEITKEEIDLQQLTFTPSDGSSQAGDQSLENYQDASQAPVNTEPTPTAGPDTHEFGLRSNTSGFQRFAPLSEYDQYFGGKPGAAAKAKASMIDEYGEEKGEEVFYATVNKKKKSSEEPELSDDKCPKCAGVHISSELSSPTSSYHECYRCGHGWETKEEDYVDEHTAGRQWIMEDSGPGGDDFFAEMERHKAMRASGAGSRNLHDVAARDQRLQAIKDHLDAEHEARTAGKKYTPREQRALIDEEGEARNADKLNLAGTHYESRWVERGFGQSANGLNAPDEHLFLGI